jgi:hypothetical protein
MVEYLDYLLLLYPTLLSMKQSRELIEESGLMTQIIERLLRLADNENPEQQDERLTATST